MHRRRAANYDALASLKAWSWGRALHETRPTCAFILAAQEYRAWDLVQSLRSTHKLLRASVRKDNVTQRLRPLLGPPKRAPLPGVKLSDGQIAPTVEDNLNRWAEHFASIEGGSRLSHEQLAALCVARQFTRNNDHFVIGRAELPSLAQVEAAVRDTSVAKAMGTEASLHTVHRLTLAGRSTHSC